MRRPLPPEVEQGRVRGESGGTISFDPALPSRQNAGNNGFFRLRIRGQWCRILSSDGLGWEHVSVSVEQSRKPPSWETMCVVKDLFWGPQEWVVQFHPAKSDYVNCHPATLHLWRPTQATLPTPETYMVGWRKDQLPS